jgi:hypothetical protein
MTDYVAKVLEVRKNLDAGNPLINELISWAPSRQTADTVRGILITMIGISTAR